MRHLQIGFLILLSGLGLAAILTSDRLHAAEHGLVPACQEACVKQISHTVPGQILTDV